MILYSVAVDMSKDEIKAIEEALQRLRHRLFPITVHTAGPLDADGSAGDQSRALRSHRTSEKRLGNHQRIYRSKTELLYPELCTGPDCMEEFEPYEVVAILPGNSPEQERLSKTGRKWLEILSRISVVRKKNPSRNRFGIWGHIEDGVIVKQKSQRSPVSVSVFRF